MTKEHKSLNWKPHTVEVAGGDQSAFVGHCMAMRMGGVECILMAQSVEDLDLALRHGFKPQRDGLEVKTYQVTMIHSTKVGVVIEEPPVVVSRPPIDVSDL